MEKTKELKKILTGNVMLNESNVLIATPPNYITRSQGALDGALEVALFGVRMETRYFLLNLRKNELNDFIDDYLSNHGRRIALADNPDAKAIFTGYIMSKPTVVAVEMDETGKKGGRQNGISFTVCTGRTIFAWLRCKRIIKGFRKYAENFIEEEREVKNERKTDRKKNDDQSEK